MICSCSMDFIWTSLKPVSVLSKMLRVSDLFAKISAKLIQIQDTLVGLQKKATGSILATVTAALVTVAAAIAAIGVAIINPEPVTRASLIVAAIGALVASVAAISNVINGMEANREAKGMERESSELKGKMKNSMS